MRLISSRALLPFFAVICLTACASSDEGDATADASTTSDAGRDAIPADTTGDGVEGDVEPEDGGDDGDQTDAAEDGSDDAGDVGEDVGEGDGGDTAGDVPEDVEEVFFITQCRLEAPTALTVASEGQVSFTGRVLIPGLTDRTTGVDSSLLVFADGGFGPVGVSPVGTTVWSWQQADPTPDWDDEDDPDWDEYTVTFAGPAEGDYDFAFRFSSDSGRSWVACDLDTGEDGEDGSENGFQPENAGRLEVLPSPCTDNPCTEPQTSCGDDDLTLATRRLPGNCTVDGLLAVCSYDLDSFDCSLLGGTCETGECVGGAALPSTGDLLVTEFMPKSKAGGGDKGEFVEIANPSDSVTYFLQGCTLEDDRSDEWTITDPLLIEPGDHLVFAGSDNPAENNGLDVDVVYSGFTLGNGGDEIVLKCDGSEVARVEYPTTLVAEGVSAQLRPRSYGNDAIGASDYCLSDPTVTYGTAGRAGTPGELNPTCQDDIVDLCRLLDPLEITVREGESVTVFGAVAEAGVTDASDFYDIVDEITGEAGYGPSDELPSDDGTWTWFAASASATDNPEVDHMEAEFAAPSQDDYAFGFRFTADGGETWTYCDKDTGEDGEDGSEDGFSLANAGLLSVSPNPCLGDPCNSELQDPFCRDDVEVTPTSVETCVVVPDGDAETFECQYESDEEDCGARLGTCDAGTCEGTAVVPTTGDLFISEAMVTPDLVSTLSGMWFEVRHAGGDDPLDLTGCVIGDDHGDSHTIGSTVLLDVSDSLVFTAGTGEATGGLPQEDYLIDSGFLLDLDGDEITLTCDSTEVARLAWVDRTPFLLGRSIQRTLSSYPGGAGEVVFCLSEESNGTYGPFGRAASPGADNAECGAHLVDHCRIEAPVDLFVLAGESQDVGVSIAESGLTDVDAFVQPAVVVQAGYGKAGSEPATDPSWTWQVAPVQAQLEGRNTYSSVFNIESVATHDFAFRVSLDAETSWTYCDRDTGEDGEDGSENGYSPDDSGVIDVQANPCQPDSCESPVFTCDDNDLVATVGTCEPILDGSVFVVDCTEPQETRSDCTIHGGTCDTDTCVGETARPEAGDVLFTELMWMPATGLEPGSAGWLELTNRSGEAMSLGGCVLADESESTTIERLLMADGERLLVGQSETDNGDLTLDLVFAGGDTVPPPNKLFTLTCPDNGEIDALNPLADELPLAVGAALQLDPDAIASGTVAAADWCIARTAYFTGEPGIDDDHYGTPGLANVECDGVFDCQTGGEDTSLLETEGVEVSIVSTMSLVGVTDATTGLDRFRPLLAELGYGPTGDDPSVDPANWTFVTAAGQDVTNEGGFDTFGLTFDVPAASGSPYAAAFRYSLDEGMNWSYCDTDGGEFSIGSAFGILAAEAPPLCEPSAAGGLIFSEYVEGSGSTNKALEIYNKSDAAIDLSECAVHLYRNGSGSHETPIPMVGSLRSGDVYVICQNGFESAEAYRCDKFAGSIDFNGDDTLELVCDGTTLDSIGQVGFQPTSPGRWGSGDVTTENDTLRRFDSVLTGDIVTDDVYDPTTEWTGYPLDTFENLGVPPCGNTACRESYDGTCPDAEGSCGATYSAGACLLEGVGNCYDSGSKAYKLAPIEGNDLEVVFAEGILAADFFFAVEGSGAATATFLDEGDGVAATTVANIDCESASEMPNRVQLTFDRPVFKLVVELDDGTTGAWIDSLTVFRYTDD